MEAPPIPLVLQQPCKVEETWAKKTATPPITREFQPLK